MPLPNGWEGAALTLSHVETDGFSAADENDGNTKADAHKSRRISFAGDYELTDNTSAGLSGFWQDSDTSCDQYSSPVCHVDGVSPDETGESESKGLRGSLKIGSALIDHELAVCAYENDRVSQGTNAWGAFR